MRSICIPKMTDFYVDFKEFGIVPEDSSVKGLFGGLWRVTDDLGYLRFFEFANKIKRMATPKNVTVLDHTGSVVEKEDAAGIEIRNISYFGILYDNKLVKFFHLAHPAKLDIHFQLFQKTLFQYHVQESVKEVIEEMGSEAGAMLDYDDLFSENRVLPPNRGEDGEPWFESDAERRKAIRRFEQIQKNIDSGAPITKAMFLKGCNTCKVMRVKMTECGRCREFYFCSEKCQKVSWPEHKKMCKEAFRKK